MSTAKVLLVLTNCPNDEVAEALARAAIESRLAACANVLAPCRSVYRWQGTIEQAIEVPVLFKTTAAGFEGLSALIRARHPYELPEIIAVDIALGLPAYLSWVVAEMEMASPVPGG